MYDNKRKYTLRFADDYLYREKFAIIRVYMGTCFPPSNAQAFKRNKILIAIFAGFFMTRGRNEV